VEGFIPMATWKPFEVSEMGVFEPYTECFNGGTLKPIVSLVGDVSIDIGCCERCGHVTYIDKPSKEAVDKYYRKTWLIDEENKAKDLRNTFAGLLKEKPDHMLGTIQRYHEKKALIELLNLDKDRPVLEIGVGLGKHIYMMEELGFKNILGVENSEQRAQAVHDSYGHSIETGSFEEITINKKLSFIQSHHVLEHVYNPDEFIAKCASLQNEGDYLLLSMPNFVDEPAMGIVFFFPHLHSFTHNSLQQLLNRHGYTVVNESLTDSNELVFLAEKKEIPTVPDVPQAYESALLKLEHGLGFKYYDHMIVWERDFDGAFHINQKHLKTKGTTTTPRAMEISTLKERKTDTPIEIQYQDKLYYK